MLSVLSVLSVSVRECACLCIHLGDPRNQLDETLLHELLDLVAGREVAKDVVAYLEALGYCEVVPVGGYEGGEGVGGDEEGVGGGGVVEDVLAGGDVVGGGSGGMGGVSNWGEGWGGRARGGGVKGGGSQRVIARGRSVAARSKNMFAGKEGK